MYVARDLSRVVLRAHHAVIRKRSGHARQQGTVKVCEILTSKKQFILPGRVVSFYNVR